MFLKVNRLSIHIQIKFKVNSGLTKAGGMQETIITTVEKDDDTGMLGKIGENAKQPSSADEKIAKKRFEKANPNIKAARMDSKTP